MFFFVFFPPYYLSFLFLLSNCVTQDHFLNKNKYGKGIMTTVPAWCVSAHASFVFKIDSQKTQCLLIALDKMQLLKKIILYVEVIFKDA